MPTFTQITNLSNVNILFLLEVLYIPSTQKYVGT